MTSDQVLGWAVTEDRGWVLTVALHCRDALGLASGRNPVPPLLPSVPPAGGQSTEEAAAQWNRWFGALLTEEKSSAGDPRGVLTDTAPESVSGELLAVAIAWADQRKLEHIQEFARQDREIWHLVNRVVSDIEREVVGRSLRPFTLRLTTLPVQGVWMWRARLDHVLVSGVVRQDAAELRRFLEPIVAELG